MRISLSLLLLIALFLTSCQGDDQAPDTTSSDPAMIESMCDMDMMQFSLDVESLSDEIGPFYNVSAATGTFSTDRCMCLVTELNLDVTQGTALQWALSSSGNNITFLSSSGAESDQLEVIDMDQIDEDVFTNGTVILRARHTPILGPVSAEVNAAGGLCIIENFDGGDVTDTFFSVPIVVKVPNPPGYDIKIYLPLSYVEAI